MWFKLCSSNVYCRVKSYCTYSLGTELVHSFSLKQGDLLVSVWRDQKKSEFTNFISMCWMMLHKLLKNNLRLVTESKWLQDFEEETYKICLVCSRMERRLISLIYSSEGFLFKVIPSIQSAPHTWKLPEENLTLPTYNQYAMLK